MSKHQFESPLPRHLDPRKFAQQRIDIAGSVAVEALPRLGDSLASAEGFVNVSLHFGMGEQRTLEVRGSIDAELAIVCQRCLDPVPMSVSCDLHLAILWKEEHAERLPKAIDPWIIGEGQTDIYQIVEDELLLSLPIVAYHENDCVPHEHFSSGENEVNKVLAETPKHNPFDVLQELKGSLKANEKDSSTDKP